MPFTGYPFLLFFLPVAIAGFGVARKFRARALSLWWLALVSMIFCGWANPRDLVVLAASIAVNYLFGCILATGNPAWRKGLLAAGLAFNCGLLLAFKYTGFLVSIVNHLAGSSIHAPALGLPLGISFYTFVQIYYLIGTYTRESGSVTFTDYLLAVTFFPKFVAGPIMRPADFVPQRDGRNVNQDAIAGGAALFAMGFAKKLLADHCAQWAVPVFAAAETPARALGLGDAWIGALAYTFQIYFDFSGYSDMAIGIGAFFGWRLPVNFNSPYKARSAIEFWRRWHITLTSFLTENIYFRLPGQRKGVVRRHINLMITMTLCGFWHGAGWNYIIWGAFHGACLVLNHVWRKAREQHSWGNAHAPLAAQALTSLCVVLGWVLFAAHTISGAGRVFLAMFGLNGLLWPQLFDARATLSAALWIVVLAACACAGPNTQEIVAAWKKRISALASGLRLLRPSWVVPGLLVLWVVGVMLFLTRKTGGGSPFIYAIF